VFIAGYAGEDLPLAVADEVEESMMGEDRPSNVTVHVGSPTRTDVTIAVQIRLAADADHDATVAAVEGAIEAAYDPARFQLDEDAPGRWRAPRTVEERVINRYDVVSVIDDIPGLGRIENVTVNGGSQVTLDGWAPLPNLTSVTVTVL
jgi:hypothetical protein